MASYEIWQEKTLTDLSSQQVNKAYDQGFVFTRKTKGNMVQTRSLRLKLAEYQANSENRRVLRKVEGLQLLAVNLPYLSTDYDWMIHKLGKDFYANKLEDVEFSASKIKELVTDPEKSNFNTMLEYTFSQNQVGYAIAYTNEVIMHYAYPFYEYERFDNNFGMGMMLKAIEYAKSKDLKYVYLGSITRATDRYKLQFDGLEWFDGKDWQTNIEQAKQVISK